MLSYASAPVMSATLAARAPIAFSRAVASPVIAAIRLDTSVLILVPLIAMVSIFVESTDDK